MPNPSQEPPTASKAPNEDLEDMDVLCTFKIKIEAKIWIMAVSKTSDLIKNKIKMPNPSQEPSASSKDPNQELKDMEILGTFKIKVAIWIICVSSTNEYIQIMIRNHNPSQEPSASSIALITILKT